MFNASSKASYSSLSNSFVRCLNFACNMFNMFISYPKVVQKSRNGNIDVRFSFNFVCYQQTRNPQNRDNKPSDSRIGTCKMRRCTDRTKKREVNTCIEESSFK